jgi:hypothetical protein
MGGGTSVGLLKKKCKEAPTAVVINEDVENILRMGLSLKRRANRRASDQSLITILRNPVIQKVDKVKYVIEMMF